MGGKGKGKGSVRKVFTESKRTWESKGKSKSGGGGRWVWVEDEPERKGRGKSKGKGKGKGKGKRAAPLTSDFWTRKVEEEGRIELGGNSSSGVIQRYSHKSGWGFIKPDSPQGLPGQVKKKLREAEQAVMAEGKEVREKGLLYFRKPDVNHEEGFKLQSGSSVTFRLYVDNKGAGALDVSMA